MNDPKKYWMKRRRYGWGWTPTTWQGWLFIVLQFAILFIALTELPAKPEQPTAHQLLRVLFTGALVIGSLVLVSGRLAPKPHWRWGKKPSDNPNEDF